MLHSIIYSQIERREGKSRIKQEFKAKFLQEEREDPQDSGSSNEAIVYLQKKVFNQLWATVGRWVYGGMPYQKDYLKA